ncbi:MAG TPA: hypothetical protein VGL23_02145 [Chloroflexota bacterium]
MSSMSTGPGDQINVDRDYEVERRSAWSWLLPLLALAVVALLLWAMFGNRGATYPTTAGSGTTISTPVSGTGPGSTTGTNPGGTGMTGSGGTSSSTGSSGTTGSTTGGTTGTGSSYGGTSSGAASKP